MSTTEKFTRVIGCFREKEFGSGAEAIARQAARTAELLSGNTSTIGTLTCITRGNLDAIGIVWTVWANDESKERLEPYVWGFQHGARYGLGLEAWLQTKR